MPSATRTQVGDQEAVLERAARKWHVPLWVLVGVYGMETTWGQNVNVSTAGAKGPFQFLDSTAAAYHVNVGSFPSSADGAAHYLSDLHRDFGSWDAALRHYSGNGYGAAEVHAKAQQVPASLGPIPFPTIPGPHGLGSGGPSLGDVFNFPSQILDAFSALLGVLKLIVSVDFWIRVGEVIAGLVLVHMGLKGLSGGYAEAAKTAKHTAEAATVAAVIK